MAHTSPTTKLYRVTAPHFVAGMEVTDGKITRAPPILQWTRNKSLTYVLEYFRRKGYKVEDLTQESNTHDTPTEPHQGQEKV